MRPEGGAGGLEPGRGLSRRSVLRGQGSGGPASGQTISIGFVTPLTGPLAGFASGDRFVLSTIKATPQYKDGFTIGGRTYKINILVVDSQGDPNLASEAARNLILNYDVDIFIDTSAPETTTPVAVVAETQGVPACPRCAHGSPGTP